MCINRNSLAGSKRVLGSTGAQYNGILDIKRKGKRVFGFSLLRSDSATIAMSRPQKRVGVPILGDLGVPLTTNPAICGFWPNPHP